MPLGGERIGSAYVRIYGDGSGLPGDIRDAMRDSEPEVRAEGRRLGEVWADRMQSGFEEQTGRNRSDFGVAIRENLERSIADADLAEGYFTNPSWRNFRDQLVERFGEAGDQAAANMERSFRRRGTLDGLEDYLGNIVSHVQDAQEEIDRETTAFYDAEFERNANHLARIERLAEEAREEEARNRSADEQKQREDRDREFDANVEYLADMARLFDEAEQREREDRDRAFETRLRQQQEYDRLFQQIEADNQAERTRALRAYQARQAEEERAGRERLRVIEELLNRRQRENDRELRENLGYLTNDINRLSGAADRLGTNLQRGSESRRRMLADLQRMQAYLDSVPRTPATDRLSGEIELIRRRTNAAHPTVDRFNGGLTRLADTMGRMSGRGSRNNFLNFLGGTVRGLTNLATLGPRIAVEVGGKMFRAFQDAGGGLKGLAASGVELGKSLGAGVGALALFGAGIAALVFILGPVAALISGIVGAITALVGTITFAALGALIALGGAVGVLGIGVGVAVGAIMGMSDEMKDRLEPQINRIKDAFIGLGESAGDVIGPKIERALRGLSPIIGRLEPLVDRVAGAVGNIFISFSDGLKSPGFTRWLFIMQTRVPGIVETLGEVLKNTLGGIGGFFAASLPFVEDFANWLEEVTQDFSDWANSAQGRQEIAEFLEKAADSAASLGDFLGTVTGLLGDLLDSGRETGDTIFDDLTRAAERFRDFLEENPQAVEDFFTNAKEVARGIGDVALAIIDIFDKLDNEESRENLQDVIDGLLDLAEVGENIGSALSGFGEAVAPLLSFMEGAVKYTPNLYSLSEVLKEISNIKIDKITIGDIIDFSVNLTPILAPIFTIPALVLRKISNKIGLGEMFKKINLGTLVSQFAALPGRIYNSLRNKVNSTGFIKIPSISQIVGFFSALPGRLMSSLRNKVASTDFIKSPNIGSIVLFFATLPARILASLINSVTSTDFIKAPDIGAIASQFAGLGSAIVNAVGRVAIDVFPRVVRGGGVGQQAPGGGIPGVDFPAPRGKTPYVPGMDGRVTGLGNTSRSVGQNGVGGKTVDASGWTLTMVGTDPKAVSDELLNRLTAAAF